MEDKFKPKCINHNLEFVLYIIKNGSKRLIKQCLCCGEKQMQNYKLNSVKNINSIPLYSLELWNKYKDNKSFSKSLYYEAKNERFEEYSNYINSDKWQLLRKEVIKEYDGKCFFCLRVFYHWHRKLVFLQRGRNQSIFTLFFLFLSNPDYRWLWTYQPHRYPCDIGCCFGSHGWTIGFCVRNRYSLCTLF